MIPKSESWKMFDRISPRYDFLNHFLSFGIDIRWRRQLCRYVPQKKGQTVLDLATGTGDVLLTLVQSTDRIAKAHGVDLAGNMLSIGRQKVEKLGLQNTIALQRGDANHIPFPDGNFDAATMAFGIRNVENPMTVLIEMYRVLKTEGRALILEFSLPDNFLWRGIHLFYLRTIVPALGGLCSGEFAAYRYLNQTIEKFPYGLRFCRMMQQVGFRNVHAHPLLGGIAVIYQGDK